MEYALPLSPALLHGVLVPLQLAIAVLLAPVGKHLQHPTRRWDNITNELSELELNFKYGLNCIILGKEKGWGLVGHSDPDWCKPLLPLVCLFVGVSFCFHYFTLSVLQCGGEKVLRYCTCVGMLFAFITLAIYDSYFQPHVAKTLPHSENVSVYSYAAIILAIFGMLFHSTIEQPEYLVIEEVASN